MRLPTVDALSTRKTELFPNVNQLTTIAANPRSIGSRRNKGRAAIAISRQVLVMIHEMYSWQHCPVPGRAWAFLALALVALVAQGRAADDLSGSLNTLRSVKKLGEGNVAASHAWRQIASASAAQIPVILEALDGANAIAANWLRAAVDSIAERSLSQGQSLPADALERFLKDARHGSASRRLAFEWLARVDAQAPERLIPGMLDDPELEFRRAAVERLIALADAKHASANAAEATAIYRQAFEKSRDIDQVKQLAAKLKELQIPVDLPKHLGLLTRWKLIGPFDNTDLSGFDIAYPPENQFDPRARYDGKRGQVGWIDHQTDE